MHTPVIAVMRTSLIAVAVALLWTHTLHAQIPPPPNIRLPHEAPTKPAPIERLGPNLFRLGQIRVDTASHEISVTGKVNGDIPTLEFVANTDRGLKAYESALSLDTDAITFNAALLLIGLDKGRSSQQPRFHFDPAAPQGDPVEIWIECPGGQCQRMRPERLLFDQGTRTTIPDGTWVYTGSGFLRDGRYIADLDGVLIGFVHDPSTIIEYVAGAGLNQYGSIVLNPNLNLAAGTPIRLVVKAIGDSTKR